MRRALCFLLLAGCQPGALDAALEAAPALDVVVRRACPDGFRPLPDDRGCEPDAPADCPPGTMPRLGAETCQPVGPRSCPTGFASDPSGWGCLAVLPATACTGATREQLGSATCQPVGDCAASFPPADATYFVNAAWTGAQLDATHVRTVSEALQAAPAGATIAVDDGTYTERLRLTRSVRVVGRCAARVIIQSGGGAVSGVRTSAGVEAEVSGLTLTGHKVGAYVDGGRLTLRDVVLQGNRELGAWVSGQGSALTVRRSVIRDTVDPTGGSLGQGVNVDLGARLELDQVVLSNNRSVGLFAADPGTTVVLTDSVVRDTKPDAANESGQGLRLEPGSTVTLTRSALVGNLERGAELVGGTLTLVDSVVSDTRSNRPDLLSPAGLFVEQQAQLELRGATVSDSVSVGVVAQGSGTRVTLVDSVVLRTSPNAQGRGAGLELSQGARGTLEGSAVVDTPPVAVVAVGAQLVLTRARVTGAQGSMAWPRATGLSVESGGCVEVEDSAIDGNQGLGVLLYELAPGCEARVVGSLIERQRPQTDGARGRGLALQGGALRLERVAVRSNLGIGLQVSRASSSLSMSDSVVSDTAFEAGGRFGYGLMAFPETVVRLSGVDVHRSAGVGLGASGATAGVQGGAFVENAVALCAFDGSEVVPTAAISEVLASKQVAVSSETRFVGNATRLGSGPVPLPDVFVPSR